MATRLRAEGTGDLGSIPDTADTAVYSAASKWTLGTTPPPIQREPVSISQE
jgi:hypothetical protein